MTKRKVGTMAKKTRLGTDPLEWIGDTRGKGKQGLPRKSKGRPSIERGLPPGWTRATFIVRKKYLDKLKALSYWYRQPIKELVDNALAEYLKGKRAKAVPKKPGKP